MTTRVVLVGWGAIGRTVARLLAETAPEIDLVGVATRRSVPADLPDRVVHCSDPTGLADLRPDVVAEAAGVDAVGPWGRAALGLGADLVVSSVAALADSSLLDELRLLALDHRARIQIQPGAVVGVEALAAARPLGFEQVVHRIVKPPRAWAGSPAEALCALDQLDRATSFFRGSAAETARAFPRNANVAMTTALASLGPDATQIELVADPHATTNRHEVSAIGGFGELSATVANQPLADNPKTSALAALSLARVLANRSAPLVI